MAADAVASCEVAAEAEPEPKGDGDADGHCDELRERAGDCEPEAPPEEEGDTVPLRLGAGVRVPLGDALPEAVRAKLELALRENVRQGAAAPEREGDAVAEELAELLLERLLVTVGEHVGFACSERKLQDSGQLQGVGADAHAGQKEPRGHATGASTILGQ